MSGNKSLHVEHSTSLKGGLAASEHLRPNVTFLDLCLPDAEDWREVANTIWAPWKDPNLTLFHPPVIVVSGMEDPDYEIELECYAQGAQNFFKKPFAQKFLGMFASTDKNFAAHLLSAAGSADLRARLQRDAHG